jgi:hypothetical protein
MTRRALHWLEAHADDADAGILILCLLAIIWLVTGGAS